MEHLNMTDCIFCKIINGTISSKPIYKDDHFFVIPDIDAQSPQHYLFISCKHYANILKAPDTIGVHMMKSLKEVATLLNIEKDGFRVVTNINENGGQSVPHFHVHVLAGRQMKWPPG